MSDRRLPTHEREPVRFLKTMLLGLVAVTTTACGNPNGLVVGTEAASPGYTLVAPLASTTTYLVDLRGEVAHSWTSRYTPGHSAYLLDDGSLLRAGRDPNNDRFRAGGEGGIIEEVSWNGVATWEYAFSTETYRQHHDIEPLPNGNVLLIAWESKTRQEALAAGLEPTRIGADEVWSEMVVEVEPVLPDGGRVVWEWHVWDHLVQDADRSRPHYGLPADHPELIDLDARTGDPPLDTDTGAAADSGAAEEIAQLSALGYLDASTDDASAMRALAADRLHVNAIDYNPELDQILLSVRNFSEIWVIDHGTTTAEAAGHAGGPHGRGGDLIWRWGNPVAHGAVTPGDRRLYHQHDARWIEAGLQGAGNILVFNNGEGRPGGSFSSVDEISPAEGAVVWSVGSADPDGFYSSRISGAQRLQNGNTLICVGDEGMLREVTPAGSVAWEYSNPFRPSWRVRLQRMNPFGDDGPGHGPPPGVPPRRPSSMASDDSPDSARDRPRPPAPDTRSIFTVRRYPTDHPGMQGLAGPSR